VIRILSYVFLLIIVVLGFTFALLNSTPTTINYYIGSTLMPLSMLLFISFVVGLLLAILISLIWIVRLKRDIYKVRHQKKQLEHDLANQPAPLVGDSNAL
jgi:uncharacterized integral membrane protein